MAELLLIAALLFGSPAAEKKRAWIDAKVIKVQMNEELNVQTNSGRDGGRMTGSNTVMYFTYTVDASGTQYDCKEQATAARFIEGQAVKIAFDKKNWFVLDEKGKEKKGDVIGHKEPKKP
jgi:hypothetical protein